MMTGQNVYRTAGRRYERDGHVSVVTIRKRQVVYRCYDDAGTCIYVGKTANPVLRFEAHGNATPWWADVAIIDIDEMADEMAEIARLRPVHNVVGNPDRRIARAEAEVAA